MVNPVRSRARASVRVLLLTGSTPLEVAHAQACASYF